MHQSMAPCIRFEQSESINQILWYLKFFLHEPSYVSFVLASGGRIQLIRLRSWCNYLRLLSVIHASGHLWSLFPRTRSTISTRADIKHALWGVIGRRLALPQESALFEIPVTQSPHFIVFLYLLPSRSSRPTIFFAANFLPGQTAHLFIPDSHAAKF